jgi:isocitrate dehydrogenase
VQKATEVSIVHTKKDGKQTVLKQNIALLEGEIFDATVMSVNALKAFLKAQIEDAKASGVLLSLHMKATMMKVS